MSLPDRLAARLRLEPAAWLLPVSTRLGATVVRDGGDQGSTYALAVAIDAHLSLIVLAPIGAGAAAWKAGRLRRGGWTATTWVRSSSRLALAEATTTALVQLIAYGVILAVTGLGSSYGAVPIDGEVIGIAGVVLFAASATGWAAGWWLRTEVAVPAVVLGSYLVLVFPPAMEPLWLRHLTGVHDDCCHHDEVLAGPAIRAPLVLGLGVAAAGLLAVAARRRPIVGIIAVGVLVIAAVGAASIADDLDVASTADRADRVHCAGEDPQLCLWPEQVAARASVSAVVDEAFDRWVAAGIVTPERVSTRPGDADAVTVVLPLGEHRGRDLVLRALAWAMVPELADGCTEDGVPIAVDDAVRVARAALARLAGVPEQHLRAELGDELLPRVRGVLGADAEARVVWLDQVRAAVLACADAAPSMP